MMEIFKFIMRSIRILYLTFNLITSIQCYRSINYPVVKKDSTIQLPCIFGNPLPSVNWLFYPLGNESYIYISKILYSWKETKDKITYKSNIYVNVSNDENGYSFNLTIKDITSQDIGKYVCMNHMISERFDLIMIDNFITTNSTYKLDWYDNILTDIIINLRCSVGYIGRETPDLNIKWSNYTDNIKTDKGISSIYQSSLKYKSNISCFIFDNKNNLLLEHTFDQKELPYYTMKNCTLDINMNCISLENYNNMIQELVENETHILPFINEIGIDIMTSYWF